MEETTGVDVWDDPGDAKDGEESLGLSHGRGGVVSEVKDSGSVWEREDSVILLSFWECLGERGLDSLP